MNRLLDRLATGALMLFLTLANIVIALVIYRLIWQMLHSYCL